MFGRGIAFVVFPVVVGKFVGQTGHQGVAVGFGKDGGCRDGEIGGIPLDDAAVGNLPSVGEAVAVHQDELRLDGELFDGEVHRVDGGVQDVHLVNVGG